MSLESHRYKPPAGGSSSADSRGLHRADTAQEVGEFHMSPVLRFSALDLACERASQTLETKAVAAGFTVAMQDVGDSVRGSADLRGRLGSTWTPECRSLMRACDGIIANAGYFNTYQISQILEAMAALGFRHEKVFQALGVELIMQKRTITGPEASRILWACAHLDIRDPGLLRPLIKTVRAIDRQDLLSPINRARIGLSLALLSPPHVDAVLSPGYLEDDNFADPTKCSIGVWGQAYHALLSTGRINRQDPFSRRGELFTLPPQGEELNTFELSVHEGLRKFLRHVPHALEVQQNVAGVFTDFVLYLEDRTIAIECDGYQYHYSTGPDGNRVFGRDLIQRSVLEACGLEVVMISSREWRVMSAQQVLLEKLGSL